MPGGSACRKSRLRPLPASPQAVAGFITAVAPTFLLLTLRRRLGGIRKGPPPDAAARNPVEDEEVLLAMRRALRSKPRRPKQAYGSASAIVPSSLPPPSRSEIGQPFCHGVKPPTVKRMLIARKISYGLAGSRIFLFDIW